MIIDLRWEEVPHTIIMSASYGRPRYPRISHRAIWENYEARLTEFEVGIELEVYPEPQRPPENGIIFGRAVLRSEPVRSIEEGKIRAAEIIVAHSTTGTVPLSAWLSEVFDFPPHGTTREEWQPNEDRFIAVAGLYFGLPRLMQEKCRGEVESLKALWMAAARRAEALAREAAAAVWDEVAKLALFGPIVPGHCASRSRLEREAAAALREKGTS